MCEQETPLTVIGGGGDDDDITRTTSGFGGHDDDDSDSSLPILPIYIVKYIDIFSWFSQIDYITDTHTHTYTNACIKRQRLTEILGFSFCCC